jgi:hypothetical protein
MDTNDTFGDKYFNFVIRQSEYNGRYQQQTAREDVIGLVSKQQHFIAYLDSSVGITTAYGLDGPGSIPGSVRSFSPPRHPDRLWGPPSPLSNRYRVLSLWGKASEA